MSQMLSLDPAVTMVNKTDMAPAPPIFTVHGEVDTNKIVPQVNRKITHCGKCTLKEKFEKM